VLKNATLHKINYNREIESNREDIFFFFFTKRVLLLLLFKNKTLKFEVVFCDCLGFFYPQGRKEREK